MSSSRLGCVRVIAAAALFICVYLVMISLTHSAPLGCGPAGGCNQLLAGRWSTWFGMPVSLPAAGVYLTTLIAACLVKSEDPAWFQSRVGRILASAAALAAMSAIWFLSLQFFQTKTFCKYCIAIHACGLLLGTLIFGSVRAPKLRFLRPAAIGLAILLLGQGVAIPNPYGVRAGAVETSVTRIEKKVAGSEPVAQHPRLIVGGRLFDLDPAQLPRLGSASAQHFIIVISDYTCEHCRVTHRMLERSEDVLGPQVGVIVLPMLLDPAENPYLPRGVTAPPQDRELTRIALAVFCARPAAFPEMNRWLFAEERSRTQEEARAYASHLVGPDALRSAESDPRVRQISLLGCELFARCGNGMIPKMLIGSTDVSGPVADVTVLLNPIRAEWGIQLKHE